MFYSPKSFMHRLCLMFCIGLTTFTWAQQDAQYTQYMYNTMSVNPGYAGSRGHLSVAALYRSQWFGLEGAPQTGTFGLHTPIGYGGMGLGLSIVNDKIGPSDETFVDFDTSYTIFLSGSANLSFGLKASVHLLDVRFTDLNQEFPDTSLQQNIDNKLSPNIGAGVYYHTDRFYAGISTPRILETEHFDSSSGSVAAERMHIYLIAGYVADIGPQVRMKPAILTKAVSGAPLQVDASLNFLFSDRFVLGGAYRWDAAWSAMAGFYIKEGMFLGLAYDKETTELGNTAFNDGSFEVILRYDFIKPAYRGLRSPRFF
ncbi:hypothetical protein B7P33_15110 [Sediminicola luteus]|uniref:Type IX secretion system membrane protein PorP/SprF n=2 Tax=Sediminicola luteus TaxID=319238 RepID=A0A2A4G4M9_9FLAO|nr:hypothetical protein B7P33_15110 [Sediminicola luteus]